MSPRQRRTPQLRLRCAFAQFFFVREYAIRHPEWTVKHHARIANRIRQGARQVQRCLEKPVLKGFTHRKTHRLEALEPDSRFLTAFESWIKAMRALPRGISFAPTTEEAFAIQRKLQGAGADRTRLESLRNGQRGNEESPKRLSERKALRKKLRRADGLAGRIEKLAEDYQRFGVEDPQLDWRVNVDDLVGRLQGEADRLHSLQRQWQVPRGPKRMSIAIRELQEHLELTTGHYYDREVAMFVNQMECERNLVGN